MGSIELLASGEARTKNETSEIREAMTEVSLRDEVVEMVLGEPRLVRCLT